ncbi:MAG: ion transporter [Desulfobulbaceae bacterium]|uniref:Ion transporter n=1 Tax=Candidatus Desulfatifera sulfidica TaxID=2841691 RepID=A0A8J6N666_9BACT|nr:ion transporter [Candidatus Desulfatifera sulfidica]
MTSSLKHRVYQLINPSEKGGRLGRLFDMFIILLIVLNILAVILSTMEHLHLRYKQAFDLFELFSVLIFTAEYLLRIWVCTCEERYQRSPLGRLRFMFTPMALIDLLAILPFYLPFFITADMRVLRALRLFRLFRVFKLARYTESLRHIRAVFVDKRGELGVVLMVVSTMLILSSSLMYLAENEAQPEVFSSIPAAMWWSVVTLTTVGYGDLYPITPFGKLLAAIIALLGVGIVALPAGIIASGFIREDMEESNAENKKHTCPHCGQDFKP